MLATVVSVWLIGVVAGAAAVVYALFWLQMGHAMLRPVLRRAADDEAGRRTDALRARWRRGEDPAPDLGDRLHARLHAAAAPYDAPPDGQVLPGIDAVSSSDMGSD